MTAAKPQVHVIGTGGSIAGIGPDRLDYILYPEIGDHLTIEQSLERVPEINDLASITSEDLVSVGSTAIGPADWLALTRRINSLMRDNPGLTGIAVTHGTATLEETAFFLHLAVKTDKPVVVTGAMRPPTSIGTDADANLMDAVRIAASPHAGGMGVLTVLNNEIHSARDVSKSNTLRVETFRPNELGFLGYSDSDGQVVFYRAPVRKHTTGHGFRNRRPRRHAPCGDCVFIRGSRRCHRGRGPADAARRTGGCGLRRRYLSPRVHSGGSQGCGRWYPGSAGFAFHRRAGRDDTEERGAGLHRVRQPPAAEGSYLADDGPDGKQGAEPAATGVFRILIQCIIREFK